MIVLSGDVANWVAAIGQVAGAIGTFAAVVVALAISRRENRALRTEQADRAAAQARLVVSEVRAERRIWWVRTTNHSGEPVFDVRVAEVRCDRARLRVQDAPGAPAVVDILAAGESRDRVLDGEAEVTATVVVQYVDARGLRWERVGRQPPRRLVDQA